MPGNWRVENGAIIGSGNHENAFLMTERNDFDDFHLRVEARINSAAADSGVMIDYTADWKYFSEISISCDSQKQNHQTGSIKVFKTEQDWIKAPRGMTFPQEWFVLEVIAQGNTITSKVNGRVATQVRHRHENVKGAIMLQQYGPATIVEFRKIEISEPEQ
jgi:hypothetical protein